MAEKKHCNVFHDVETAIKNPNTITARTGHAHYGREFEKRVKKSLYGEAEEIKEETNKIKHP